MMLGVDPVDQFSDPSWRLSNLYLIQDKRGRQVVFRPNTSQLRLLDSMSAHPRQVVLKARQRGFTTLIDLWLLDKAVWSSNWASGIIAHNLDDAKVIYRTKVDYPYRHLPEGIRNALDAKVTRADEIVFSNGSSVRVSTGYRSGTLQALHVSEMGKIAAQRPDRAREIMTGALEAVPIGGTVIIESTAEGREGVFFDLVSAGQKLEQMGSDLGPLDFAIFFEPWWKNPEYSIDGSFDSNLESYFSDIEERNKINLTKEQMAWYSAKKNILGNDMLREYPSTSEEAFESSIEGSYYRDQMTVARRQGRMGRVPHNPLVGVDTYWDLGWDDSMAIWFAQQDGQDYALIDYYEASNEPIQHFADVLRGKRGSGGEPYVYRDLWLPHDGKKHQADGRTIVDMLRELGFQSIRTAVRPRNNDELIQQIQQVRGFLSVVRIDSDRCAQGIKCLDSYRKSWNERLGAFSERPLHNWASHGADALRTGVVGAWRRSDVHEEYDLDPEEEPDF